VIVPLPAVAFELSRLFPPLQNELFPVIVADGAALIDTTKEVEVNEHPLLLVIVTVYDPAAVAVYVEEFAPLIAEPLRFH